MIKIINKMLIMMKVIILINNCINNKNNNLTSFTCHSHLTYNVIDT